VGLTYVFFLFEFLLFNAFGSWGKPNLLIILIVFFNLYLGIRYGLMAGFAAGVLKDAFSTQVFGIYIFLFMVCAFLATILRRNFYRPGSRVSRLVVTGGVVILFVLCQAILFAMNTDIEWSGVFTNVFLPELTATMLCATIVFTRLKYLADKLHL
jgi:rod shape-determining protein MreD